MIRGSMLILAVALLTDNAIAQQRGAQIDPPSIVEYQPRSTLVVPEHPVPRPRYPVVDFHGHPPRLTSVAAVRQLLLQMDSIGIDVMVQASGTSGETLRQQLDAIRQAGAEKRFAVFTTLAIVAILLIRGAGG